MFRAVPLPNIRSFPQYIQHWYMSDWFVDSLKALELSSKLYDILPVPNVQWKTPDDG